MNKKTNIYGIEKMLLHDFTQKAYLDYATYVITDRALPSIGDGLKPVQRRIVYAMFELGLKSTSKHKKSARTIGDVLGKFHPHGDTACYEAMVLMAQSFSYRYPIVDGQGNWGAPEDPKSFAAMRYTEARLSKYANILLSEIDMGTIKWKPNFDGTLNEPIELPARLPNILLNGTTGIAVGMSTDIPSHNINEIVKACILLIDTPTTSTNDLCKHINGPDFPTGGEIITSKQEIIDIYKKGRGNIRVRGTFTIEEEVIAITSLPYQVPTSRIINQINNQINNQKIPFSLRIRNESDHENPIRIVIIPPKNTKNINELMSHLFATTELEKSLRINMNVIGINGKPKTKNLVRLLTEWILFRKKTITMRLEYKLKQIRNRLEIFAGLLITYQNIDKIINIIRNKKNSAKILKTKFNLNDPQVANILNLKLRNLARLEETKIKSEENQLLNEKHRIQKILNSEKELKNLIKKELRSDAKKYGNTRLTTLVSRNTAKAFSGENLASHDPVTVILSKKGWARIAKGHTVKHENILYKPGDQYLDSTRCFNNQKIIFFDSSGRAYSLYAYTLPSIRGYGEPLTSRFEIPSGEVLKSVIVYDGSKQLLLSTTGGDGFITKKELIFTTSRKGKSLITLVGKSQILPPIEIENIENKLIFIFTNSGRLLVFPLKKLPILTRGKGNKIIEIDQEKDFVKILKLVSTDSNIVIFAGKRYLIMNLKKREQYIGKKGSIGKKLPRGYQNVTDAEVRS